MIDPSTADIGKTVIYRSRPGGPTETGAIISFNAFYVFVRYGRSHASAATRREDLYWPDPPAPLPDAA